MGKVIRIDAEVFAWLQSQANPLRDSPNSVLRRVAGLPTMPALPRDVKVREFTSGRKTKLTPEQVIEMRRRYLAGGVSMAALAKKYGVVPTNAYLAIRGKTWAELPGAVPAQPTRSVRTLASLIASGRKA